MAEALFLDEVEIGSNAERSKDILAQVKPDRRQKLVSSVTKSGLTVAHWACLNNNLALLKLLRLEDPELKIDVPIKKAVPKFRAFSSIPKGSTPLHCACMVNSPECARFLLDCEVDVNSADALGRTPLCAAAFYNNIEVLSMIANHPSVKPDFELAITMDEGLPIGCTALMAAASGSVECVSELLGHFANPDAVDINGWAAIHYAARVGNIAVIKKLIAAEANIDLQTSQHLFKQSSNLNAKPKLEAAAGSSPLHIAIKYATDRSAKKQLFIDCISLLVQSGCKPNLQDSRGWSPAMSICLTGDSTMLAALINAAKQRNMNIDFSLESKEKVQARVPNDPSNSNEISRRSMSVSMSSPIAAQIEDTVVVELPAGSTAWDIGRARQAMSCLELLVLTEVEAEGLGDSEEDTSGTPKKVRPSSKLVTKDPVKQYMISNIKASRKLMVQKKKREAETGQEIKATPSPAPEVLATVQSEIVNLKHENTKLSGDLLLAKERERQALQDLEHLKEEQARIDLQADLLKEKNEMEEKIAKLIKERDLALATARELTRGARGREITAGMSRSYSPNVGSLPNLPPFPVGSLPISTNGYGSPTNSPPDSPPPPGARMIMRKGAAARDRRNSGSYASGMMHQMRADNNDDCESDFEDTEPASRKGPQRADGRPIISKDVSRSGHQSKAGARTESDKVEEGCCSGCSMM